MRKFIFPVVVLCSAMMLSFSAHSKGSANSYSKSYVIGQSKNCSKYHSKRNSSRYSNKCGDKYSKGDSRQYGKQHGKHYGKNNSKGKTKELAKSYSRAYPKSYAKSYSKSYSKSHSQGYSKSYAKTYSKGYSTDYVKSYSKRPSKAKLKRQSRSYNKGYSNGFIGHGYIGIEGTSLSVDENLDGDLNPKGIRFKLGVPLANNFDIEAQFGYSADTSTRSFEDLSVRYAGAYLKGYLPLGFNSALYGLVGYSNVELTQTVSGNEFTDERFGFSYGAGLETRLSERLDLTADFMRYVQDEGLFKDISAVSLGLKLYF